MKIGILTLHSQINYGGVLQAYALQRVLRNEKYDVEIIDYWLTPTNTHLYGGGNNPLIPVIARLRKLLRFVVRCDFVGFYYYLLSNRFAHTIMFIKQEISLSKHSYKTQYDLESLEGYDCVIVGSDQVWNPKYKPNPFLLDKIDSNIRRIAYAASFGVKEIDKSRYEEYSSSWKKFYAIGVREKAGQMLVRKIVQQEAMWVLDPTLMLTQEDWSLLCQKAPTKEAFIFCYWLGDICSIYPYLLDIVLQTGKKVLLYTNLSLNCSGNQCKRLKMQLRLCLNRNIVHMVSGGPREFLTDLSASDGIITDSFHGLMFACVFRKPLQVVVNSSPERTEMSERFTDFMKRYDMQSLLYSTIPVRFSGFEKIDYDRVFCEIDKEKQLSLNFLKKALDLHG